MSDMIIDSQILTDIANAIRSKTGSTEQISPSDMSTNINNIITPTGKYIEEVYDDNNNLTNVTMHGYDFIRSGAFYNSTNLTSISLDNINSIGSHAFYGCQNLVLTSLPENLTTIDGYAFYGCYGLTDITFKGTPTSIKTTSFSDCPNLLSIKVPWAEGEVANAPWGANKATITYNYTEEELTQ